ncbi:Isochorismatase [Phytophthora palmivora]|uniref:Isochorismatase n=1 Tax=Phytophthora palmivora TaxID=4796 RepID=A0A2P4XZZ8_9STRA|nr:Isochorismatase [Phytophthora palmivora]
MALSTATKRLGRLLPQSSVLFVCDVQEVFRGLTFQLPTVIHGTNTMVRHPLRPDRHSTNTLCLCQVSAAKLLNVPVVVTTQYGSRLGSTVSEISKNLEDVQDVKIFDKMKFSMLVPEVESHLTTTMPHRKSVLLCGIETHVCVLQTCLDLLDKGYDVHVVSDAVSSSTSYNRSMALERMRQSGAYITSVESAIFQLANDASNPEFKSISKLIKEHLKMENGFDTGARI